MIFRKEFPVIAGTHQILISPAESKRKQNNVFETFPESEIFVL